MAGKPVDAPRHLSRLRFGHRLEGEAKLELLAVGHLAEPDQLGTKGQRGLALTEGEFEGDRRGDRPVDRAQTTHPIQAQVFAQRLNHPVLALRVESDGQVATDSRLLPALRHHNIFIILNPTAPVNKIPRLTVTQKRRA